MPLRILGTLASDPVIFLSLVAPLFLRTALRLIQGEAAMSAVEPNPYLDFFDHKFLPGFTDYVVQFYTAVLAGVVLCIKSTEKIFIPMFYSNRLRTQSEWGWYVVVFVLVGFYGAFVFMQGAANRDTLDIYVNHMDSFGEWQLPPITSHITIVRLLVLGLGVWSILLTTGKPLSAAWGFIRRRIRGAKTIGGQ